MGLDGTSLGDANRHLHKRRPCQPRPPGCDRGGPEQPPEACLARPDRAAHRARRGHGRDHSNGGGQQDRGLALAGTVHERRRRLRRFPSSVQFGGLAKVGSGSFYAASWSSGLALFGASPG